MIPRYGFPIIILASCASGAFGGLTLYVPLIVVSIYSLFSIDLGWSEKFFTLVLYAYSLAFSATGFSPLGDAFFLAVIAFSPITIITLEVERLLSEYRITTGLVEVRSIRRDSLFPRQSVQQVPLYLVIDTTVKVPLLARLLRQSYVDLHLKTETGTIVLKGVPLTSPVVTRLSRLRDERDSILEVSSNSITLSSHGDAFEVSGVFQPKRAKEPLLYFYQFLQFFANTFNATLSIQEKEQENEERKNKKTKAADVEQDKDTSQNRRWRNKIERLL